MLQIKIKFFDASSICVCSSLPFTANLAPNVIVDPCLRGFRQGKLLTSQLSKQDYEGDSICNGKPIITLPTNALVVLYLETSSIIQGVQKNDNTFNRYLFLYNNLNLYVFNIN